MRNIVLFLLLSVSIISCKYKSTTNESQQKIDELTDKISELEQKEKEREQEKINVEEQKKAADLQKKKDLIIEQIKAGMALEPQIYGYDPISTGGINNAKLKIENDLSGIVFQVLKAKYTVLLANGNIYKSEEYTFTNLKPGESREKILFNTGTRGTKYEAVITEIQSKWLTNGKSIRLDE